MLKKYWLSNSCLPLLTARLINEVTKAELKIEESEGEIDMCKAIDDMRKESIAEGEARGMAAGKLEGKIEALNQNIKTMYKNGFDIETIARALSLDLGFVKVALAK